MYESFHEEGRDAFLEGIPIEACPYTRGEMQRWWLLGWTEEFKDNLQAVVALQFRTFEEMRNVRQK